MDAKRCPWVNLDNKIYVDYHDNEWGIPVHDDRMHFEMLTLEGAQAGLSWETILKKRDNYKKAFDNFDVLKIASYDAQKITELMQNSGIIRNKLKITSTIKNAGVFLQIQKEFGSFDTYIWSYIGNQPIQNFFTTLGDYPAKTDLSDIISKDLKKRGMSFVGSTIIYAYMQAVGLTNDHSADCFLKSK